MGNFIKIPAAPKRKPKNEPTNGLYLCDHYIPEEVVSLILSYVSPNEILKLTLVCKNWNNIIKNPNLWLKIYKRTYPKRKVKDLPWYVYYVLLATNFFDTNLIKNGNGEEEFKNWTTETPTFKDCKYYGFEVEKVPLDVPSLPIEVLDFNGNKSCFNACDRYSFKCQVIELNSRPVYSSILKKYKPHILASEWTCCNNNHNNSWTDYLYILNVQVSDKSKKIMKFTERKYFDKSTDPVWEKVEIKVIDYPKDIKKVIFEHEATNTVMFGDRTNIKTAGAVVKILFDSIK